MITDDGWGRLVLYREGVSLIYVYMGGVKLYPARSGAAKTFAEPAMDT